MILIDDRIGSGEIAPYVSAPKMVCRLEFADFAIDGNGPNGPVNVGIERKGLDDIIQSMTSGRLAGHQLIGLQENYDFIYVLVEGVWRPDQHSGVLMRTNGRGKWVALTQGSRRFMARDLYAFLQTLSVICGVHVVQTSNRQETGKLLDALHGWWNKKWKDHKSHLQWQEPKKYASLQKPNLTTRIAAQFEGIGWDKAQKIGAAFGLSEFIGVRPGQLQKVDGIGPKLEESVRDQIEDADWGEG